MNDLIPTVEIYRTLFNKSVEILNDYFKGNRNKIKELELAIEELDEQILLKLSNDSPEKIVDYLAKKVDLYLKIEDLKVKRETSFMNWLKNWSPVLIPIIVAITTTIGVIIGTQLNNSKIKETERTEKEIEFERQLILNAFETRESDILDKEIKRLINADLINHYESKLTVFLKPVIEADTVLSKDTSQIMKNELNLDTIKYATQQ